MSVEELTTGCADGSVTEVFAAGTAAVIQFGRVADPRGWRVPVDRSAIVTPNSPSSDTT